MGSLCREGASALAFMAEVKCEPEVSIPYPTEASPILASPPSAVHHQGPNSIKPLEKTRATHVLVHMAKDSEPRHPHTHNLTHRTRYPIPNPLTPQCAGSSADLGYRIFDFISNQTLLTPQCAGSSADTGFRIFHFISDQKTLTPHGAGSSPDGRGRCDRGHVAPCRGRGRQHRERSDSSALLPPQL